MHIRELEKDLIFSMKGLASIVSRIIQWRLQILSTSMSYLSISPFTDIMNFEKNKNDWLKKNLETIANNTDSSFNEEQVERAKTMLYTLKVSVFAMTRQAPFRCSVNDLLDRCSEGLDAFVDNSHD
ncbi:hypothetical protein Glove_1g4 [Diversispora epigaea]|uniref:Uncharacterized protein n=1 Tax=Diversispora epigaea TaxID=1348612 RepID=A0A397JQS4_9GLOM|nr:hypothetical protein Glove_1g4 [Diversispora epigaea]